MATEETSEERRKRELSSALNAARLRGKQRRVHALSVQRGQRRRRLALRRERGV